MGLAGTLRITNIVNAIAGFQVNGVALASTHLSDSAALARLASPVFTGTPTAPTPATADNSTAIATTAFVKNQGYTSTSNVNLTGIPTAATAPVDTNTTQLATTAFVIGQGATTLPAMNGTASAGTSTRWAHADHVHPTDTSRAPLASPALTGTPTAPTPAAGDNSTALATTAFVRTILPAGVIVPYAGATAPNGWLLCDGTLQNRTTQAALFAAISTTYGAGDGSTTFGIPDLRGRVPVGKAASGTFNTLGGTGGAETHAITIAEMPNHDHGGVTGGSGTLTTGTESADHTHSGSTGGRSAAHSHSFTIDGDTFLAGNAGTQKIIRDVNGVFGATTGSTVSTSTGTESSDHTHSFTTGGRSAAHTHTIASHTHTVSAQGSGTAMSLIQPFQVVNYIIKT